VRGVLLEHSVTDVHVEFLRHKGFPLVVIGDYPISVPVANVAFDQEQAMYQVAQALMRNFTSMPVYFLTEPFRLHYSQMLDAGYRRACEEAGRRPNTRFVWDQVGRPGLEVQRIVDENPGPFGLIVHANIAHELVKIFDKHQLKLSDHPVVILGAADYVSPPVQKQLNRCRVDIPLASSVALDLLDEVIQHDSTRKIYIQPELETSVVDNCFRVNLSWRL
jgi:DNA-binding LacI/PurR family transcriptional regulator